MPDLIHMMIHISLPGDALYWFKILQDNKVLYSSGRLPCAHGWLMSAHYLGQIFQIRGSRVIRI